MGFWVLVVGVEMLIGSLFIFQGAIMKYYISSEPTFFY